MVSLSMEEIKMIDYKTDKWYENTYNSLGSKWLINSLKKLKLTRNYVLVNLSANAGYYERDAYEYEINNGRNPTYYLSDLYGDELANPRASVKVSPTGFIQISGNNNACDFDVSRIKQQADVVVDIKGAMWYMFRENQDISKIKVLIEKYLSILSEDGVFLTDAYVGLAIRGQFERLLGFKGKKKSKLYNFGEASTLHTLRKALGENISSDIKLLNVSEVDSNYPLAKYMNVTVLSKNDLIDIQKALEELNDRDARRMFRRTSKTWLIKRLTKIICLASVIAVILLIIMFVRLVLICNQRGILIWSVF